MQLTPSEQRELAREVVERQREREDVERAIRAARAERRGREAMLREWWARELRRGAVLREPWGAELTEWRIKGGRVQVRGVRADGTFAKFDPTCDPDGWHYRFREGCPDVDNAEALAEHLWRRQFHGMPQVVITGDGCWPDGRA